MELRQCTRHCRTPNSYSSFCSSSGRWSNCAVTTIVQIQTSVRELLQGYWYFQCYCASLLLDLSVLGWLRAAEPRRPRGTGRQEQVSVSKLGDCLRRSDFYSQNGSGGAAPCGRCQLLAGAAMAPVRLLYVMLSHQDPAGQPCIICNCNRYKWINNFCKVVVSLPFWHCKLYSYRYFRSIIF